MANKEMKETIIKNSKKSSKENIIKNFDAITNMTKEPEDEPTAEELAKMDMTLEEWRAQNLDNIYTPEAPEIEKPKGK